MTVELQHHLQHKENTRRLWSFFIGVTVMIAAFGIYFISQQESIQKEYIYPYHYRDLIMENSQRFEVDDSLVVAVVKTESKFKPDSVSSRGALGLMQLMPETAQWISTQLDDLDYRDAIMLIPELNLYYGTWYLSTLLEEFKGNEVLALAAYNAGRGNVLNWMKDNGWDYNFSNPNNIPYAETREYVKTVLKYKAKYEALYGSSK